MMDNIFEKYWMLSEFVVPLDHDVLSKVFRGELVN